LTLIHINAPRRDAGHQSAMLEGLHWLGAFCSADTAFQGGLLLGLLTAGAAGSVVHCGPMCGVFVLGQVSERMDRLPADRLCQSQRIGNGLLLPYHLGRLTTYAGLGALAAGSLGFFGRQAWFGDLSGALLMIAALLFLTKALALVLPSVVNIDRAPRVWSRLIGTLARRIERGSAFGEYLFGLALGFLPCGLLYAAIAAAAASGRPAIGAAAMVAFGLGTAPVLMLIGVVGRAAGRRWNRAVTVAAPVLMTLNAALLLALAWQRLT
jgi:sulfite exporter TauE/SafE